MTVSKPSLMLGGSQIRVYDGHVGQVKGAYVERTVTKASHDTNFGLEFRTDHVIAIKTAYTIGWTFEEMQPHNANLLVGSPGYSIVPADRSLPGSRLSPALLSYGQTRRQYTEYVGMLRDRTEAPKGATYYPGIWHSLLYPLATPTTGAFEPPQLSAFNTEYTGGTPSGWIAICIDIATGGGIRSLPSNIEYIPLSAADDTITATWVLPQGMSIPVGPKYTLYLCAVTRDAVTGLFVHAAPFLSQTTFEVIDWPAANPDGTYSFTFDADVGNDASPVEPVTPITVSLFDNATQAWVAKSWPEDFQYEAKRRGGGAVRLSPSSALDTAGTGGTRCKVDYYYDISRIRELPLDASGRNPIVPVTMEVLFPDMDSKMIWHFYRAQVNTNMRFAAQENDWYGQDFMCETLDDSNQHPAYGFGYLQLVGDNIVDEIQAYGNLPYGIQRVLGDNQTVYA